MKEDVGIRRKKQKGLRADNDSTLLEEKLHCNLKVRHNVTKRGISISGPFIWNSLPQLLRESASVAEFKKISKAPSIC